MALNDDDEQFNVELMDGRAARHASQMPQLARSLAANYFSDSGVEGERRSRNKAAENCWLSFLPQAATPSVQHRHQMELSVVRFGE